eukprot:4729188-Pleurochrysis_carterae.AAC.1
MLFRRFIVSLIRSLEAHTALTRHARSAAALALNRTGVSHRVLAACDRYQVYIRKHRCSTALPSCRRGGAGKGQGYSACRHAETP